MPPVGAITRSKFPEIVALSTEDRVAFLAKELRVKLALFDATRANRNRPAPSESGGVDGA